MIVSRSDAMKGWLFLLLVSLSGAAFATTVMYFAPAERFKLSVFSKSILLVEVASATWKPAEVKAEWETRDLEISGKVLEVVRGEKGQKVFNHTCKDHRLVDRAAFVKKNGMGMLDSFTGPPRSELNGAAELKPGGRYLVIKAIGDVYFTPVAPGDESWRAKILPFDPDITPKEDPGS